MTRKAISRRDFMQGRFWRVLGLRQHPTPSAQTPKTQTPKTQTPKTQTPIGDSSAPGSDNPAGSSDPCTQVVRYPKTRADVVANQSTLDGASRSQTIDPGSFLRAASDPEAERSPNERRRTIPVLRPPGAIREESFLLGCTRCGKCIHACPHSAIVLAPIRFREAAGTPMIDPDHQPCLMCADFPCIAACEPQVLTQFVPKLMGTARVTQQTCLAYNNSACTLCSERCPVPGAIRLADGKPRIEEAVCSGCGVCRYVCPAPENAILLMPTFLRPAAQSASSE